MFIVTCFIAVCFK